MSMFELGQIVVFILLVGSEAANAVAEETPGTPLAVGMTVDVAQLCFQDANSVPDFRFEERAIADDEVNLETVTDTDTDTDTEIIDPCALAIQNNNLTQRDLAASYSNQGIILSSRGEYALAIISHTQAIALLENSEEFGISESIYINRGNTYFAMQEYEAANADYSRVILLSAGTQHQAMYNRALVFKALGYTQRALEEMEHALLLDPDNPRYLASHSLLRRVDPIPEAGSEFDWEKPGETLD